MRGQGHHAAPLRVRAHHEVRSSTYPQSLYCPFRCSLAILLDRRLHARGLPVAVNLKQLFWSLRSCSLVPSSFAVSCMSINGYGLVCL